MLLHCSHRTLGVGGRWLLASAGAACLALTALAGPPVIGAPAGDTSTATPVAAAGTFDVQAANNVLVTERLLAQFYNTNAQKSYLGGTVPVTSPPGIVTPTPAGTNPTGTTSPVFTGPVLAAALSGAAEAPAVTTQATGTASFTLSQDQTAVLYQIQVTGLTDTPTAVRVRRGLPGQPGGIILYTLNPLVNGVSSGQFAIRPADVSILLNNEFYVEITTDQHPDGEIRGQLVLPTPGTNPPVPVVTPTGSTSALQSVVNEIRANHNAHVATLEQMMATSALAAPTFQNLDAPTLAQFLIMATTLEDFAVGVDQNAVLIPAPNLVSTTPGVTPIPLTQGVIATEVAILADNGRHAGGLRAYRKLASTADGGDPNITLTEHGAPFNIAHTQTELNAFLQPYLATTAP